MIALVLLSCGEYEQAQRTALPMYVNVEDEESLNKDNLGKVFAGHFALTYMMGNKPPKKGEKYKCRHCGSILDGKSNWEIENSQADYVDTMTNDFWRFVTLTSHEDIDYDIEQRMEALGWHPWMNVQPDKVVVIDNVDSYLEAFLNEEDIFS